MIAPVPTALSLRVKRALKRQGPLWRFLTALHRAVEAAGGATSLVGGSVRDLIEGCPGRDVDLMVTGITFPVLGKVLRSLPAASLGIRRVLPVGKAFPVYKVSTVWSHEAVDVAMARTERFTGPGHRQFEVRTGRIDAREDASRRDFTINALQFAFFLENGALSGRIQDHFGGLEDLERRRIRAVGDPEERLREDPLRMLRAIRQKSERWGYAIEKGTWEAVRRVVPKLFGTIPGERVVGELLRSLSADPSGTVADLRRAGILTLLLPIPPERLDASVRRMKRRYALLRKSLGYPLPELLLLAGLLLDVADAECREKIRTGAPEKIRFRLSRSDAAARRLHFPQVRRVVALVEDVMRLVHVRRMENRLARIEAIFGRWETPRPLLALYSATQGAARRKASDFLPILRNAARKPPLINGKTLLAMGIPSGPKVESILEKVREATLSGEVGSRDAAVRLAAATYRGDSAASSCGHVYRSLRNRKRARRNPATESARGR